MLKQISRNGILGEVITSIKPKYDNRILLKEIALNSIYPNPFNNFTIIEFRVNKSVQVQLEIYDVLGKKIHTLIKDQLYPNTYRVRWDGTDHSGQSVSSGIYFCRLLVGDQSAVTQKILFIQ